MSIYDTIMHFCSIMLGIFLSSGLCIATPCVWPMYECMYPECIKLGCNGGNTMCMAGVCQASSCSGVWSACPCPTTTCSAFTYLNGCACTWCDFGYYCPGGVHALKIANKICQAGIEYTSKGWSPDSDIVCSPCTVCGPNMYTKVMCFATANTQCGTCTVCEADHFAKTACSTSADTVCIACAVCGPGMFAKSACNATQDTSCAVCSACPVGTYKKAACNASIDTICSNCSTCAAGTYVSQSCTSTADVICQPCTTCQKNNGTYMAVPCNGVSNRICCPFNSSWTPEHPCLHFAWQIAPTR